MSQITLTGGTLIPPTPASNGIASGDSNGTGQNDNGIEMAHVSSKGNDASLDELVKGTEEDICRTLSTLMRFGRFEAFPPIVEKLEENNRSVPDIVLKRFDQGGHTLIHWAAKRVDDLRFLQTLVELAKKYNLIPEVLNVASKDSVGMRPIHWACTEGSIPNAAILLKNGADPEAKDNSGCTPLLIAAQYGQVEMVAYMLKKGANIQAVDSSLDTALHWAAYKGSTEVCGLLSYYNQLSFGTQDAYGQTPLHLSALRGHTSVVRYILGRLDRTKKPEREVLFLQDKNQRTPLDLAIHKNRPNVEIVLKEAMANAEDPRGHFFRKTLWTNLKDLVSLKTWKKWMGLAPRGLDEMDTPTKIPYYIVIIDLVIHFVLMVGVMAPFANTASGLLWDRSGTLMINFITMFFTWYFYAKTVKTSPGYMDDSMPGIQKWRQLYEDTLEYLADETNYMGDEKMEERPFQLCHTSHVARPYRSKYCRVSRKCVLLFDHFCPFVNNTVGLNNYKYFYMFLMSIFLGIGSFCVTLMTYTFRYKKMHGSYPWLVIAVGGQICTILFPVGGLFLYHTQLTLMNLSTNEHINMRRYKYLHPVINGRRVYKNPWDKGYLGNFMDRFYPSPACYEIHSDFQSLINKNAPMPSSGCCKHGKCESV
mmetsp:Transcript_18337/g.42257  ORF Transcript_18337/g.42257 Transcript_18337/m.42257 type:complete len:648 (+) Transcript_18337:105-2048(+)